MLLATLTLNKGAFTNYVDKILVVFDHVSIPCGHFLYHVCIVHVDNQKFTTPPRFHRLGPVYYRCSRIDESFCCTWIRDLLQDKNIWLSLWQTFIPLSSRVDDLWFWGKFSNHLVSISFTFYKFKQYEDNWSKEFSIYVHVDNGAFSLTIS